MDYSGSVRRWWPIQGVGKRRPREGFAGAGFSSHVDTQMPNETLHNYNAFISMFMHDIQSLWSMCSSETPPPGAENMLTRLCISAHMEGGVFFS
jgi:hypothetical protein